MTELAPQSQLEEQLDKVDLADRRNDKYFVVLYWVRSLNIVSIYLEDERTNYAAEFVVDNDKALRYFYHPFTHENALLTKKEGHPFQGDVEE